MARVKRGVTARAAHKKILKQAKGYFGRRKNTFRSAVQAVEKAGQYAYRDRRTKKRNFRGTDFLDYEGKVNHPTRWLFFAEAEHVVGLYYGARG